ncbi:alpha/beta fold hydrolase [Ruania halotolerans]|uniref:alpha/beta fold hydrolase n=1 Tax=Ruania halotolerans TaxID=2897773 RepID=UPI001E4F94C7|nr:alpha/beta fold hydrolase [Ruania halotolerans]UFU06962.1 alpha/beta fold hydrolase [Ruania halotolerans]
MTARPSERSMGGRGRAVLDPVTRLAVRELGDPMAEAVVLVHGIGASERYFRPLAAELATTRRVIVPDLPGFGRSPRPDSAPSVEQIAGTVLQMLKRRQVNAATLVGHSMGTQVVAAMMNQAPHLAPVGVLIGPVVDPAAASAAGQAWRLARDAFHEPARVNASVIVDYLRAGPRWYSAMLRPMFAFDTLAAVTQVRGRVLVVRGQYDRVCSRAWAQELANAAAHGEMREVPGAAHAATAVDPAIVGQWIRDGAAGVGPTGGAA